MTVEDDGRGIPVDMHKGEKTAAEVIMTQLHAGVSHDSYKVSEDCMGLEFQLLMLYLRNYLNIYRDGNEYEINFKDGTSIKPLKKLVKQKKKELK